ncbi:MAG: hypothetical protein DWQ10_04235 [Calditrichaeota bacterium]|nr:MAG: hypothetical protein DWQ10_04235 [Calditrichota bacterium]
MPTTPGPQNLSGPATLTIPAGTVTPGLNYTCTVVGTYSVTFTGGSQGNGTISGTVDTEICIVEPSPINELVPHLDMSLLPVNNQPFPVCRRGDQNTLFYLIENNDPNETVTLDLTTTVI